MKNIHTYKNFKNPLFEQRSVFLEGGEKGAQEVERGQELGKEGEKKLRVLQGEDEMFKKATDALRPGSNASEEERKAATDLIKVLNEYKMFANDAYADENSQRAWIDGAMKKLSSVRVLKDVNPKKVQIVVDSGKQDVKNPTGTSASE